MKRIIHSEDDLRTSINRLRALHRLYVPSKARDKFKYQINTLLDLAIAQGIITHTQRGEFYGPPLES